VVGALGPGRSSRLDHHARAQCHQILVVASIQGHIVNLRVLERAAQGGVGRLHQRDGFGDRYVLSLLTGLDGQVNPNFLTYLEHYVLTLDGPEPFDLYADRVGARNQGGSVILAGLIGGQRSRHAPIFIYDRVRSARYNSSPLICSRAENAYEIALGKQRKREQQHTQNRTEHAHTFSGSADLQYRTHSAP